MAKICFLLLLVVAVLAMTGCASSNSGSREFVPGQGWVPVQN